MGKNQAKVLLSGVFVFRNIKYSFMDITTHIQSLKCNALQPTLMWFIHDNTHHMMMATRRMMASLRESKKSLSAWPSSFIFPMIRPKHMENTTSPRALTPFVVPEIGMISS